MHSGGGSSSVVSVAPATPIVKHMIGIAALVLEGRDRGGAAAAGGLDMTSTKSKDTTVVATTVTASVIPRPAMASTSSSAAVSGPSSALYTPLDATAVAAAIATNSNTTSNWARAQNNRLAHIYRLKNRLLVESSSASGQSNSASNRSSPVPLDYDQLAMGCGAGGGGGVDDEAFGGVYDPMQHLTSARTCRLTTPRSFLNLQMVEKRQTSSSSSCSSTGSSGVTTVTAPSTSSACGGGGGGGVLSSGGGSGSGGVATGQQLPITGGRRNSRSSPVPVIPAMATRTHCDDFLRTIGLLKGAGGGVGATSIGSAIVVAGKGPATPATAVNMLVAEDESHYCDEVVSSEVSAN